jgi:hypothetical protein
MDVSVNQAGKQRAIAQVYYLSAGGMLHRGSNLEDPFIPNQNFCRLEHAPGLHVEETGGVQHNRMRWNRLRLSRRIGGVNQYQ